MHCAAIHARDASLPAAANGGGGTWRPTGYGRLLQKFWATTNFATTALLSHTEILMVSKYSGYVRRRVPVPGKKSTDKAGLKCWLNIKVPRDNSEESVRTLFAYDGREGGAGDVLRARLR